jgi:glycosyltransferase involved in cell wall biosynthesis
MKKKLILGVTVGGSSRLLDGQAKYFKDLGYEVYLISQDHFKEPIFCQKEGINHLPVKDLIAEIHPFKDIKAFFQILKYFLKVKPDIVNVGTAKMGLMGVIAAKILGVPKIIYTCRGYRFETETGLLKLLLINFDRLIMNLSDHIIYVSPSLQIKAKKYKFPYKLKSTMIGFGSSNGVNINAFQKGKISLDEREKLISKYELENKLVIGFVGRVTQHKGVYELMDAFEKLFSENQNLRLIMVGHIKCEDSFEQRFRAHPGFIQIPFQDDVPLYMSLFDIFVLPSWREGFPNVPIQAAAMGIPVVVSDATGCIDSVEDGVNGTIFQVKDSHALYKVLKKYIDHPELRINHGAKGLDWAKQFDQKKIWNGIQKIYEL